MPQHEIKFIAADMDGTLLDEHGQLDTCFFDIYPQLEERQIMFAAASGRQYQTLANMFEPVKNTMMFIAENGTLVMHQGKEIYSCTLEKQYIRQIIDTARSIDGAHIVLAGKKTAYIETQCPEALEEFSKYYHSCEYVEDLLSVDDDFIKVAICHFGGSEKNLYPIMNEHFGQNHQVVVSGKIWLDLMNTKASKGEAIQYLQKKLGFTYEQSMSFGDYLNDVEMLQSTYYSYAMENAHHEVKRHARFSAPSNQESGVLKVISDYFLSEPAVLESSY